MQSVSKTAVSLPEVQAIVHRQFGTQRDVRTCEELKDGYFNAAYKVTLDDGFDCVLKVAPSLDVPVLTYEKGIMTAEVEVMRRVQVQTDMPAPAILCHDTSGAIIANEYYLMAFVPGISLQAARQRDPDRDFTAVDRELGRLLAQMNAITAEAFGYFTPAATRYSHWRGAFKAMVEGVLADGEAMGVELPLGYGELRARIEPGYVALDAVQTPRLVHWDLWDGNIFIDPAAGRLTGIIDFERAPWADPLIEQNFIRENEAFLAGYGKVIPATPDEHIRRTLYNIYLFLVMIVEHYYRRYPSNELERFGRWQMINALEKLEGLAETRLK